MSAGVRFLIMAVAFGASAQGCTPLGAASSLAIDNPSSDLRTNEITAQLAVSVNGPTAHAHATFFDAKGASVVLTGVDRVLCNGVELMQESASRPVSYDVDFSSAPATSPYRFELRRSSGEIVATETDTPSRVTVTAPARGASTRLGEPVALAWAPALGSGANVIIDIVVVDGPCRSHVEDAPYFPDDGSATVDGSMFAGAGGRSCTFDLRVSRGRSRPVSSSFGDGGLFLSMEDTVRVVASP